jgi:hypothetical protein
MEMNYWAQYYGLRPIFLDKPFAHSQPPSRQPNPSAAAAGSSALAVGRAATASSLAAQLAYPTWGNIKFSLLCILSPTSFALFYWTCPLNRSVSFR